MHKKIEQKVSKKSITENIDLIENEFDSSDDEDYMRELDNVFETFQCEDECENEDNIPEVPGPSRRRKSDLGPLAATVTDSDSSDDIFRRRPRVRRISSDESVCDIPVADHSSWVDVSKQDNYYPNIDFTTGSKVTGPQIPVFCSTPLQFFQLFFTDELIRKIVSETNKYAANILATKNISKYSIWKTWTDVNEIEMKAFLGVVINMGLIEVPELQDYWSQAFHSNIPFFGRIFSRRRFMQIFWTLHLETIPTKIHGPITRTQKVNNFLMYIESKCRQHFVPDKYLSIDESTVGFKGRISFLAYNPKKPTKWGLRVYVLADSQTSYIYSFVPYYGKITTDGLIKPELSFTSRIVLHLYNNLLTSIPEAAGYHIFTDRFYTNLILAKDLFENKCFLTSTIMPNQKGLPQEIKKTQVTERKNNCFLQRQYPFTSLV